KLLLAVEQARLEADGMAAAAAKSKAARSADALVRAAGQIRQAESDRVRIGHSPASALVASVPTSVKGLVRGASSAEFVLPTEPPPRSGRVVGWLVGPYVRAVLAAVLLVGCGLWAHQNGLL